MKGVTCVGESFHWTCWIIDTCPNLTVSGENFHLTQALSKQELLNYFEILHTN